MPQYGKRKLTQLTQSLLVALAIGLSRPGLAGARRRLLDQNCPATYPISFAGTCYLCPSDHPYFLNRKCYTNQVAASSVSTSNGDSVQATSQPITDPPTSGQQTATTAAPANQGTVSTLTGATVTTYNCQDSSQIMWNNTCYSCPNEHPFFSEGSCYNVNPSVSSTNPNSASAAAARQTSAGNNPNPGGGGLIEGGR